MLTNAVLLLADIMAVSKRVNMSSAFHTKLRMHPNELLSGASTRLIFFTFVDNFSANQVHGLNHTLKSISSNLSTYCLRESQTYHVMTVLDSRNDRQGQRT